MIRDKPFFTFTIGLGLTTPNYHCSIASKDNKGYLIPAILSFGSKFVYNKWMSRMDLP